MHIFADPARHIASVAFDYLIGAGLDDRVPVLDVTPANSVWGARHLDDIPSILLPAKQDNKDRSAPSTVM
jgi:hypothetical protein